MKEKEEFFVPYIEGSLGKRTQMTLKIFGIIIIVAIIFVALAFSLSQKEFKNSTFELSTETKLIGIYHESPYPMLRVKLSENEFKNILLLGFGKSGVNPYLDHLRSENKSLEGMTLSIEGNLIYYNGKTLIQITDNEKVQIKEKRKSLTPQTTAIGQYVLSGEIVDPKCYFGVMKPGKGKIHRSCAVLCISGGIPPVFVSDQEIKGSKYLLLTDMNGYPVNNEILEYIGKSIEIKGIIEQNEDWLLFKIDPKTIKELEQSSSIY